MNVAGKQVIVVGAGASGLSAAALLCRLGARVALNDRRSEAELGDAALKARALGVALRSGSHDEAFFADAELVVVSPGVPPLPAFDALAARGVSVIAEVELAAPYLRSTLIAVTGTNGKSTVTTLIGQMCAATSAPTFVGGNLGTALSEAAFTPAAEPGGFVVAELSSFQLERIHELHPQVAVLLNVTPDHLDRYPDLEHYAAAKGRIFSTQAPGDHAVIPAADAVCERLARAGEAQVHRFGAGGEVRVEGDAIVGESGFHFSLGRLRLVGKHNQENACASILAALLAGVSAPAIEQALAEFRGLPHRAMLIRELDGVLYVDDSKATNVGATLAALDGLASPARRVVLIAGGIDKGGSYAPLADRMREVGRAVVLIGVAAPLIRAALASLPMPIEDAPTLEAAVSQARLLAKRGDLVLLAPACSSFDMFRSYAHRGDVFSEAVRALSEVA